MDYEHRCRTCPYCRIGHATGECRRYAPKDPGPQGKVKWPRMDLDVDWCGDHPQVQLAVRDEMYPVMVADATRLPLNVEAAVAEAEKVKAEDLAE